MTVDETRKILEVIKIAYPDFHKDADDAKKTAVLKLWHLQLGKYSYEQCNDAVMRLISETPYNPKISDIVQRINAEIAIKLEREKSERQRLEEMASLVRACDAMGVAVSAEFRAASEGKIISQKRELPDRIADRFREHREAI